MILVVGLSHRTAPLGLREALAFPRERSPGALGRLRGEAGLAEAMILSTCNRVEVYGRQAEAPALDAVAAFLAAFHERRADELQGALYRLSGEDAVRHAFRVV